MVIVIDPQIAGISGDMLLSSLVNLGADKNKIIDGYYKIPKNFFQVLLLKKWIFRKYKNVELNPLN